MGWEGIRISGNSRAVRDMGWDEMDRCECWTLGRCVVQKVYYERGMGMCWLGEVYLRCGIREVRYALPLEWDAVVEFGKRYSDEI